MLFGDKTFSKLTTPERSPELDLVGVLETICLWIFPEPAEPVMLVSFIYAAGEPKRSDVSAGLVGASLGETFLNLYGLVSISPPSTRRVSVV